MGLILPGHAASSLLAVAGESPRHFAAGSCSQRGGRRASPACTASPVPTGALGHSAWELLPAAPALLTRGVSRADGTNGQTLLPSARFPGGALANKWTKKALKQNKKECERIKSFSIPGLCFSCYLETGTESNVPFASRSSWDLRGTLSAWVPSLLEAIRQGNFTSS